MNVIEVDSGGGTDADGGGGYANDVLLFPVEPDRAYRERGCSARRAEQPGGRKGYRDRDMIARVTQEFCWCSCLGHGKKQISGECNRQKRTSQPPAASASELKSPYEQALRGVWGGPTGHTIRQGSSPLPC